MIDEYKFCDSFKEWFLTIDSTFKNKQGVNKPRLQKLYSYVSIHFRFSHPHIVMPVANQNASCLVRRIRTWWPWTVV